MTYSSMIIDATPQSRISKSDRTIFIRTGQEAASAIGDRRQKCAAIFLNPLISDPGGIQLISLAHRHRPATPIYLLYDKEKPFTSSDMAGLAIHEMIPKPLTQDAIRARISKEIFEYTNEQTGNEESIEQSDVDSGFVPVPASDFLTGAPSFFDIYLRLGTGKYVKIVDAHDSLAPERTLNYIRKGVNYFYFSKVAYKRCLDYCALLSKFLYRQPGASFELKMADTLSQTQSVIGLIQRNGLSPEYYDQSVEILDKSRILIENVMAADSEYIHNFLANINAYDHGVSTMVVSTLLALPLRSSENQLAFDSISLAAFLHDVGLYQLAPELQSEEESEMTEEQKLIYRHHPQIGKNLILQIQNSDVHVAQAISQHHQRLNGKGFPNLASPPEVSMIGQIIGVSDEFVRMLSKFKGLPSIDILIKMEQDVFGGFSDPVVDAFKKMFIK